MAKISIIMGTYNSKNRIKPSIDSIIAQTFSDWELIICDDGSNDGSYEYLKRLTAIECRIKIIKNDKNLGLQYALNECINVSSGMYVARMDDDDISLPSRLAKQFKFLEENPEYAIVGTSRYLFDEKQTWGLDILEGERNLLDIVKGNNFIHPSVMMRKDVLNKVGNYTIDRNVNRLEDYDLWCKFYLNNYRGYNLKEPLILYFEDRNSIKKRNLKQRTSEFSLKKYWFIKFKMNKKHFLLVIKPLIAIFIPSIILLRLHKNKYKL